MKKKIWLIMLSVLVIIGLSTAAYAKAGTPGFGRGMMGSSGTNYSKMIQLMQQNGFTEAAQAMKDRDFSAMSTFMQDLTDDQYNKMIDIMNKNGYGSMAKMMGSLSRQDMINMHNSMMGR